MSQIVLYFVHNTPILSFYIDVILTLPIDLNCGFDKKKCSCHDFYLLAFYKYSAGSNMLSHDKIHDIQDQ